MFKIFYIQGLILENLPLKKSSENSNTLIVPILSNACSKYNKQTSVKDKYIPVEVTFWQGKDIE